MSITINIPYWHTDEDRLWNVGYATKSAMLLSAYLNENGYVSTVNVFDFSMEQKLPEAIHIPTKGLFDKSKKLNRAIDWLTLSGDRYDWMCFWDADCFIDERDFPTVLQMLNAICGRFVCNNMNKLRKRSYVHPDGSKVSREFCMFYSSGVIKGLGAIWFCPFRKVVDVGGFDEKYTDWGREDEEIGKRLVDSGLSFMRAPFDIWHLPHPPSPTKEHYKENILTWD